MAILNTSEPAASNAQGGENTSIRLCNENTEALKKVNKKINDLLARLPLCNQKLIVEMNRLIEEQERLVKIRIKGHVPLRVETLNDNEKHRASHLRRRFVEAERSGKIRNCLR